LSQPCADLSTRRLTSDRSCARSRSSCRRTPNDTSQRKIRATNQVATQELPSYAACRGGGLRAWPGTPRRCCSCETPRRTWMRHCSWHPTCSALLEYDPQQDYAKAKRCLERPDSVSQRWTSCSDQSETGVVHGACRVAHRRAVLPSSPNPISRGSTPMGGLRVAVSALEAAEGPGGQGFRGRPHRGCTNPLFCFFPIDGRNS
jgi:hypothetical protein